MSTRLLYRAGPLVPYWVSFGAVWALIGLESHVRRGPILVALGLQVLIVAALAVRDRWDHRPWVGVAGLMLFLVSVAVLREGVGPQAGVFGLLVLLAVAWAAVRSRRGELGLALAGLALFVAATVARHERYPPIDWTVGVLLVFGGTVLGVTVLALVERLRAGERRYERSVEQFRALAANFPHGFVVLFDSELRYLIADGPALADFDLSAGEMEGKTVTEAFKEPLATSLSLRYRAALAGEEQRWTWQSQAGREYELTAVPVRDAGGEIFAGAVVTVDISVRLQAQRQVVEHQRDLLAVARTARTLAHQTDGGQASLTVCAAVRELTGATTATIWQRGDDGSLVNLGADGMSQPRFTLVPGRDEDAALNCAGEQRPLFIAEARTPTYFEPLKVNGATLGVLAVSWSHGMTELPERSRLLLGLLADEAATAMQRARLLEELAQLARTDQLTGLPNRRSWDERAPRELARAAREGHPVSIALLDLDHFKAYNDQRGHLAGDRLLKSIAVAWTRTLRANDLLCRWGGEEFVVLMAGCDPSQAHELIERMRSLIPDGQTCSAGLTDWDGAAGIDDLIRRADIALYDAKGAGRDNIVTA